MESRISGNVVRKCASAAFVLAVATAAFAAEIDDGIKDGTHGYTPKGYVQPKEKEKRGGRQALPCVTAAKVVHVGTGREFVCEKTVDGATVDLPADFKADANADVFKMVR